MSYLKFFTQPCHGNIQLLAIFGHCSSGNWKAFFLEKIGQRIVGNRFPLIFGINYILKDKWNINTSLYYYGKQTFVMNRSYNMYGTDHISAKALVNVKVSYEFMKNNKVFVNVRNLLDDRSNEFAFADEIGAKFFGGVN